MKLILDFLISKPPCLEVIKINIIHKIVSNQRNLRFSFVLDETLKGIRGVRLDNR